jgi:hypothetical protein
MDYTLDTDCKQGTINGQDPTNLAEAELLNAACQLAYGGAASGYAACCQIKIIEYDNMGHC